MKEEPRYRSPSLFGRRGKDGGNQATVQAALAYLSSLLGTVMAGYFLADYLGKEWILPLFVLVGVFGNLVFLMRRLNKIQEQDENRDRRGP